MGFLAILFGRPISFQRIAHWAALGLFAGLLISFNVVRTQRDDARSALDAEQEAHALTRANYRAAAAVARNMAQARAQRVERAAAQINQEIDDAYSRRIAAARSRAAAADTINSAVRMRDAVAAGAAGGGAGGGGLPGVSDATRGVDAATCEAGLPGALSTADALIATEQAIQLDALIDWIEAQQRSFRRELGDDGSE